MLANSNALVDAIFTVQTPILEEVRSTVNVINVFQKADELWGRLTTEAAGDRAMEVLLKVAELTYDESDRRFEQLIGKIVVEARTDYDEMHAHFAETKNYEEKPADIYRRWARPLRFIKDLGFIAAGSILRDIMMDQTIPFDELDNPDWIDPYTGAIDPDAERPGSIHIRTSETGDEAEDAAAEFSESFDNEPFEDEEEFYDVYDVKPFLQQEMNEDLATRDYGFLRHDSDPEAQGLREAMRRELDKQKVKQAPALFLLAEKAFPKQDTGALLKAVANTLDNKIVSDLDFKVLHCLSSKLKSVRGEMFEMAREEVRHSIEAKSFLDRLQSYADTGESSVDIALLFLSFQHGLCFDEFDSQAIKLVGQYPTLFDFIEEYEDEILANLDNSAGIRNVEPSKEFIEQEADKIILAYASMGDPNSTVVRNTPAYIEGYLRAACTLRNISQGKLAEAGYDAYRRSISIYANEVYHQCRAKKMDMKSSMRQFWLAVEHEKQMASIKTVRPDGLLLSTGRLVNYKIATLKVKNGELKLNADGMMRLLTLLQKHGWGSELAKYIQG